jgi:flavin reductase (DIM6/NTAB) family NADH-FMN oxidoreductase RutF
LDPKSCYKLVSGLVVPRPIALTTTKSVKGVVNAAPFSFFNLYSEDPVVVVLGLSDNPDGSTKDTLNNMRETGEFVVHVVTEDIAEKMNVCSTEFPPDISEIDIANFSLTPSRVVSPPTIAEAAMAIECKVMSITPVSTQRVLIIGEGVRVRARPGIVDKERMYVDLAAYRPIARLFGNLYAYLGDSFELRRLSFEEWRKQNKD